MSEKFSLDNSGWKNKMRYTTKAPMQPITVFNGASHFDVPALTCKDLTL